MKKELCAIATLLLLMTGAAANLIHLRNINEQIISYGDYTALYCSLEDYEAAHKEITKALQLWKGAEAYSRIFIRSPDIDAVYNLIFEILSAVENREKSDAICFINKLNHQVESIIFSETLLAESIF